MGGVLCVDTDGVILLAIIYPILDFLDKCG